MQKVEFVYISNLVEKAWLQSFCCPVIDSNFWMFLIPQLFSYLKSGEDSSNFVLELIDLHLLHVMYKLVGKKHLKVFEGVRHNTSLVCNKLSSLQILFLCSTGACSPGEDGCIEGCINGEI